MNKVDYKKDFKELYLPKEKPVILTVPAINFILLEGQGDPNGEEFALATAALYSFSYAVKMSYKGKNVPNGYYEYTVFPLEGEWDLVDTSLSHEDKNNLKYKIMIRQPDFLNADSAERFISEIKKKKPNKFFDKLQLTSISEGLCCQMLHKGSYDSEPASFALMEKFCEENGYARLSKSHREIYLSDPRKTAPDLLKTVLRFRVLAK